MTVSITNFAMPPRTTNGPIGKRGSKYPLGDLTPGSDQAIMLDGVDPKKDHSKLSSAVANFRKANPGTPAQFSIRTFSINVDGVAQTRVGLWRLADKVAAPAADAAAE